MAQGGQRARRCSKPVVCSPSLGACGRRVSSACCGLSYQQQVQLDQFIDSGRSTDGILRISGKPRELVFEQGQNHVDEVTGPLSSSCVIEISHKNMQASSKLACIELTRSDPVRRVPPPQPLTADAGEEGGRSQRSVLSAD
jgi:hypothetical protein